MPSPSILSQKQKQFFHNMDFLLDDEDVDDDHDLNLITPPRSRSKSRLNNPSSSLSEKESLSPRKVFSPGLSTATSPTHTAMTEKSKESTIIYTCPEPKEIFDTDLDENENADVSRVNPVATVNPSGMVIHTKYAKEAILDPTWLDSDDEEEDTDGYINDSLLSVNGSASNGCSNGSVGLDDCAKSACSMTSNSRHSRGWSIGTGSSLSVGSCGLGLGKISYSDGSGCGASFCSLEGSIDLNSSNRSGKIVFNQIDIVDVGVESVSSRSDCSDHVLDYLYDLDRKDYGLSDGEGDADDEVLSADSHKDEDSAYLPQYLMSPPRLSRRKSRSNCDEEEEEDSKVSSDSSHHYSIASEEVSTTTEESVHVEKKDTKKILGAADSVATSITMETLETESSKQSFATVSPLPSPEVVAISDDDQSASSTDETNIWSNCSPPVPLLLNEDPAGIFRGDTVLSILDCPGNRTRKKRIARGGADSGIQWGAHAVKSTISCMRFVRKLNGEVVPDQVLSSSLAPEKTGRILRNAEEQAVKPSGDCVSPVKHSTRSLVSGSFSVVSAGSRSPHRSQRLENMAFEYLKCNDFDSALPVFRQILRIYVDQAKHCENNGEDVHETQSYVSSTLFNIGIVHLCKAEYDSAMKSFMEAEEKAIDSSEDDRNNRIDINIMKGLVHYANENFESALKLWNSALFRLRRSKTKQTNVMAELSNNIGCIHFESGSEVRALKYLKESLQMQKKVIFGSVYDGNEKFRQHMLMKLAITRANLAYIYLRMKNTDQAISAFQDSLLDQDICLEPHHPLLASTMDYFAIALVRKGDKDEAIQVYSKMLTAVIEENCDNHQECVAILTKLNLLQLKAKDKEGAGLCMKNIQKSIRDDGPCQKQRWEKLMKVCKISGLKPISVRGKKAASKVVIKVPRSSTG